MRDEEEGLEEGQDQEGQAGLGHRSGRLPPFHPKDHGGGEEGAGPRYDRLLGTRWVVRGAGLIGEGEAFIRIYTHGCKW